MELPGQEVLHRLFHDEDVRVFEPVPIAFRCSCSRERVANMLKSLGHEEIKAILAEEEVIAIDCEFCYQQYEFDKVDAEQLFASDVPLQGPKSTQ